MNRELFWNPVLGNDASSGITPGAPVRTVSRIQTLLDGFSNTDPVSIYLKTKPYSLEQLLSTNWFDERLSFGPTKIAPIALRAWSDAVQPLIPYKRITDWVSTGTNSYKSTDAVASAILYEVPDPADPLSLKRLTLITGAALPAAVDTTPGSYWVGPDATNGNVTTIFMRPFTASNPNSGFFVRTRSNTGNVPWLLMNAAESLVSQISIAGMGLRTNAGANVSGLYGAVISETAKYAKIEGCEFRHAQDHLFGVNHGSTQTNNQLVDIVDTKWNQIASGAGPLIFFSGHNDSYGNVVNVIRGSCTKSTEVNGSIAGSDTISAVYGHNTNTADVTNHQISVHFDGVEFGTTLLSPPTGATGQNFYERLSYRNCKSLTGGIIWTLCPNTPVTRCFNLAAIPCNLHGGAGVIVRQCHIKAISNHNNSVAAHLQNQGLIDLYDCKLDPSEANQAVVGDKAWFSRIGVMTFRLRRCDVDLRAANGARMSLVAGAMPADTLSLNYNRYRNRFGFDPIGQYNGSELAFATWKSTTGQDANSTETLDSTTVDWIESTLGFSDPAYTESKYEQLEPPSLTGSGLNIRGQL